MVAGAVGALLAAERGMSASASGSWWRLLLLEVRAVVTDLRTQWAVVLSLWVYLGSCWWWTELRMRGSRVAASRWGWRGLVGMPAWGGISYGIGYGKGAGEYAGLLAMVVAGWCLVLWMTRGGGETRLRRSLFGFGVLVSWLTVLSWVEAPPGARFQYLGVERLSGFWGIRMRPVY